MLTAYDTRAANDADTLLTSDLILPEDREQVASTLLDCVRGERTPRWLGATTPEPLAHITLTINLWYAGHVQKMRCIEWPRREAETPVEFGHRALDAMRGLAAPYFGRTNVVTLDINAYTRRELDVIHHIEMTL